VCTACRHMPLLSCTAQRAHTIQTTCCAPIPWHQHMYCPYHSVTQPPFCTACIAHSMHA
jgi:hypothetical protein